MRSPYCQPQDAPGDEDWYSLAEVSHQFALKGDRVSEAPIVFVSQSRGLAIPGEHKLVEYFRLVV